MRQIKFRAWDENEKSWYVPTAYQVEFTRANEFFVVNGREIRFNRGDIILNQFTGLLDKNEPKTCIYEDDIVSLSGLIIGNRHEHSDLLEDQSNLLIEGFGKKAWLATYQKAVDRGCTDSE